MYKVACLLLFVAIVYCQETTIDPCVVAKIFKIANPNCVEATPPPVLTQPTTQASGNRNQQPSTIVPPVNKDLNRDLLNKPCKLTDGRTGECVNHYQCNNGTVNTDGENIIDIRTFDDNPCGSVLLVCCSIEDKRPEPVTPKPMPRPEGCGWINPNGADMRTTGETQGETKFGEFPWMVALLDTESKSTARTDSPQGLQQYIGGGTLIHPSVVLTAAHNVDKINPRNLKIRAGEWDTQTTAELYPYQERGVASIVIHKDYIRGNLFYDVALLFLEQPVDLAPHIGVACLPPRRQKARSGTRCFATGWGKEKFEKEGSYSAILKKIELPVVQFRNCESALRRTRLGPKFELHSSFMCAGGEKGKDVCKGDGGSPLSCPIENEQDRYVHSGIVAWGIGCGEDGTPGVYVDVAIMRDWIDDKMAGKGYEPDSYKYD